jgi:predicted permease
MLSPLWQDARFGVRLLRRQPVFTSIAVASLAIGIGLNSTIFTIVDALLFRQMPVRSAETLVTVFTTGEDGMTEATSSWPDLLDIRARNTVFSSVVGHTIMFAAVNVAGEKRLTFGEVVSANYFSALGIAPQIGRGFLPEEEQGEGAHPVVVISDQLWRTAFGGRAAALQEQILIRNRPYTIVGVAPKAFTGLMPGIRAEMWIPVSMVDDVSPAGINDVSASATGRTRLERRGTRWLFVKARLRDGIGVAAAAANLATIATALEQEYPVSNRKRYLHTHAASSVRFHPMVDRALRPAGALAMGAVGLVLLAACANLASMLLARGAGRTRELALRSALGAGRRRIIRQLLVESLMLAVLGGAIGLLIANWATAGLAQAKLPIELPISFVLGIDGRVLTFTMAISLATGLLFGLMPAWRASRADLVGALKGDATMAAPGRRFGLRHALVALQVAVSVVFIVTGVLLVRSFVAARAMTTGFETRGLVVATISLDMQGYDDARARVFFDRAMERLTRLPGVRAGAVSDRVPFSPNVLYTQVSIDGRPEATPEEGASVDEARVSASYFDTMGVALVEGRGFGPADTPDRPSVAVVSQAFARRYFPGESAVGRRLRLGGQRGAPVEIVGVSADYNVRAVGETPRPVLHLARSQRFSPSASFLIQAAGDPDALRRDVERELQVLEPNLVFLELAPIQRMIATSLLPVSLASALLGGLAALAMLLAALGLYGVVAFTVAQRRREIGVRMALGASRARVVRAIMREALVMVSAGAVVGLGVAGGAAHALSAVLFGVTPFDPVSYAIAVAIVAATAVGSSVWPARRAASIDPIAALRS